jgi:glycosyltransferase involved in cell wall biosynthesis
VRALVVSNMLADAAHPERGTFVRDHVAALRRLDGLDVELFEFAPGPRALMAAAREMRARWRDAQLDVVHAHFSLSALPALALRARVRALSVHGTDVRHPRTRLITRALMGRMDLIAAVSDELAAQLPTRKARERALVLPCGVDLERFKPMPRRDARAQLGLDAGRPYLLFPADPARRSKRFDLAQALAAGLGVELLTLGGIAPELVPLWHNAANAVVVPSDREGFGLAVIEALACEVPVLATPVGIHRQALAGIEGALCAPFDLSAWRAAASGPLNETDPRIAGRARARTFSADASAKRVLEAWRALLERLA